ncbi:MAG: ABC transporter substrate-binding protein [Pontibacterium sp.]
MEKAFKTDSHQPAIRWLMVLLTLVFAQVVFARPLIVLSEETPSYQSVLARIKNQHTDATPVSARQVNQTPNILLEEDWDYYVAVGTRATDLLLSRLPDASAAVLSTFIPRRSYQNLLDKHHNCPTVIRNNITAIFLDQPYRRQLQLARLIQPNAKILSVAFSTTSANDLSLLKEASQSTNFTLKHVILDENESPIKQLQPLIKNSDIFLTLPDQAVFNRTTAKWILYISFRQRTPLIGFSKKYVTAGAAAGVYSSADQIGLQTAEFMMHLGQLSRPLLSPAYPRYFSVVTNPSAARSLRLDLPLPEKLEQALKEAEQ